MDRFDDWFADRRLTRATIGPHLNDPGRLGTPVAPGVTSHTTLITNPANLVQPSIRYDIGDRVTWRTERCSCGNAWPAIHVEGRTDDILDFTNASGGRVSLLPLALATALEEHANVYGFQLARSSARHLA